MTTPAPTTTSNGSSSGSGGSGASDLGSALTRLVSEAEAGGLKSKTRVALTLGEGHKMSAAYLEQYARHLQEKGEYPAFAWEPVRQAAAMITAAASKLTEHSTAMQTIANTPMGEAAGKAPAKPELDKE